MYYSCVIAALWGTVQAYPEIYSRVTHDFFSAIWPRKRFSLPLFRLVIAIYVLLVATPLVWVNISFSTMTAIVGFLATNAGVALAMLAALYLDRCCRPATARVVVLCRGRALRDHPHRCQLHQRLGTFPEHWATRHQGRSVFLSRTGAGG